MEEKIRISMLMDYYGGLFTEKQRYILDLYFNDDLSLSEISEHTSTSRQAIYDIIKRCEKQLNNYEGLLGLMKREDNIRNFKNTLLKKIDNLDKDNIDELIFDIKNYISENL